MKKSPLLGIIAATALIAGCLQVQAANIRQEAQVNVKAVPAASCQCSSSWCHGGQGLATGTGDSQVGINDATSYKNRRGCSPSGYMYFWWNTDGTAQVTNASGSNEWGAAASQQTGKVSHAYGDQSGYIYWTVTCKNDAGDATTCSDFTLLSCFPAGTLITLVDADGNTYQKAIEQVQVGETILAWDPKTQSYTTSVVQHTVETTSNSLFEFKDANGDDLKITPTHQMYIEGKGFIASENVKVGDILVTNPDGAKVAITSVATIPGDVKVYNLTTSEPNDFFAQNILVHNVDQIKGHKNHGFAAGTMIQTVHGPMAIEQIKAGEKLVAWNPKTGKFSANPVLQTGEQKVAKTILINDSLRIGTALPLFLAKDKKAPSLTQPQQ